VAVSDVLKRAVKAPTLNVPAFVPVETSPPVKTIGESGSIIAYSGTNNFTMTSGVAYGGINRFALGSYNSATTTFTPIYQDGSDGWTEGAARNTIDYAHYDDGDGTLGNVGVARYGVHWVYRHIDDDHVYVLYGRDSYTLAEAEVAGEPTKPDHLTDFGLLVGKIIAPQAGGSFSAVQMVTDTFFVGTNVSNHNQLGGLQGGTTDEYYHLTSAQHTIATQEADANVSGYLTSTDWNTFNAKITTSSLSSSATGLTYTSNTGVFSWTAGYEGLRVTSSTAWNTAVGWGDHSLAGYLVGTNNLSDVSNAETARGNLGVAIGSDVQAWDDDLDDLAGITPTKGDLLVTAGTNWTDLSIGSDGKVLTASSTAPYGVSWESIGGTGTVTSVDMSVPTGFTISGNPITSAGTLALGFDTGYSMVKTASSTNFQTAYEERGSQIAGDFLTWNTNKLDVSDNWWNADGDISADEISESKINFTTACGAGNHLYVSGNDLACEADDDTTYSAGTNLTLDGTTFNVNDAFLKNDAVDEGVGLTLTGDNSSADTAYVPMTLYGTDDTPPTASNFPHGTIYLQYTP